MSISSNRSRTLWSLEQLIVKATPLVLIGVGLAVCYLANVWNIGAEGQLTMGAIFGGLHSRPVSGWQSPLTLACMLLLGIVGGMLYGADSGASQEHASTPTRS